MPDSVAIWPPGFRVTDSADNPIVGATIEFYDAGTSSARTVYSDSDLSTSLGSIVYTDSTGAPVSASGSSTRVTVYTGVTSFKTLIKDGNGVVLETKDNLSGAIDTSPFTAAAVARPSRPVVATASDLVLTTALHQGRVINCDPTGGDIVITLLSAVTAGDGWLVTIRNVGSTGKVTIQTVQQQTLTVPIAGAAEAAPEAIELVGFADSVELVSDGVDWHAGSVALGLKLGSGYHAEVYDIGTVTGGTTTPDPEQANLQTLTNNAAFTLAPPAENTNVVILMTNGASAGAMDTSAFSKVGGDTIVTTSGYQYLLSITRIGSVSRLYIEGMQ